MDYGLIAVLACSYLLIGIVFNAVVEGVSPAPLKVKRRRALIVQVFWPLCALMLVAIIVYFVCLDWWRAHYRG